MYRITTQRNGLAWAGIALLWCVSQAVSAASAHSGPNHDRHAKYPQATLQAQAATEVAHDRVRVTLAAEISDESQDAISSSLSATLRQATKVARENTDDIKVTSGSYRIWPMNDKQGHISNWRGRGEIYLESGNFEATSKLAARLSDDLAIASMSFFVSPQERARQEEELLAQAAAAFQKRAQALTKALGYADYRIRSVDLGGAGVQYESAPRMAAMSASYKAADSVPLEGGTETINVSVNGSIYLLEQK